MAIFIGALLTLLSIGVVLYPFLKPGAASRQSTPSPGPNSESPDEGSELEAIYEAIQTLHLEHQLGNVPQGLYREQLGAYRRQAALVLRRQMELPGQDEDRVLEQEIMLARASLPFLPSGPATGLPIGSTASCPNCGATFGAGLARCPQCSVELGFAGQESSVQ
jgi:hypothetical protein